MGSSKKHKEKRDKKKHRKERSRSRSQERDGHRRSHKSKKEHERRKEDRSEYSDETKASERSKYDDKRDLSNYLGEEEEQRYDKKVFPRYEIEVPVSTSQDSDDDDIDIDQLLDSKLQPEFSVKKASTKKISVVEKLRGVELLSKRKKQGGQHDDHSDNVVTTVQSYASYNEYLEDGEEKGSWNAREKSSFFQKPEVKEEYPDETVTSLPEQADIGDSGQVHLSLSISEANKLRAKLGLKPLDVAETIPGLGDVAEEASSETSKNEVFVKTTNIAEVKNTEKLKEKIQVMKEKRKIIQKLSTVKAIGESDTEDESAAAWVEKSRKLQKEKEQAEKRAKLLEEMDAEFGVTALVEEEFNVRKKNSYTSKDLKGLKVMHDSSVLQEGQQVVLTLKDKGVLDEEEDVLQNVNLVDEERYAKNVENRKRKKDYQPYEEEYDEFGILQKKTILSKYDEEIYGEKKKTFTLGANMQLDKEKEIEMIRMKLKQQKGVTLEMPALKLASEYYTSDDMVQFKRPKKKRKVRKAPMLKADDLMANLQEESSIDFGSRNSAAATESVNEFHSWEPAYQTRDDTEMRDPDEDDVILGEDLTKIVIEEDQAEKELQSALHKARKLKQRKSLLAPEKLAVEVLKQSETVEAHESSSSKSGPIVMNSTAEFCRTLGDIPTYGMSGNRDEEADELMDFERELMEERQRQEMEAQNRGAWNEVNIDETPGEIMVRENEPILEEEPDISLGVAGALKLAQKKGYLDKETKKQLTGPRTSQLQAKSYTIEEKFYEDDKFGKRDRCTGPIQDFREKGSYKPDVKLEYIDDSGRLLNAKEAFRYLSHKFHGKGPGKNKVDKRMKKLDQDTKLKQMSSTDTPLNTVKLLQAKQKETQSPYIVLSGGSKALTQTMISKPKHP